jgi:hypothetical protein
MRLGKQNPRVHPGSIKFPSFLGVISPLVRNLVASRQQA